MGTVTSRTLAEPKVLLSCSTHSSNFVDDRRDSLKSEARVGRLTGSRSCRWDSYLRCRRGRQRMERTSLVPLASGRTIHRPPELTNPTWRTSDRTDRWGLELMNPTWLTSGRTDRWGLKLARSIPPVAGRRGRQRRPELPRSARLLSEQRYFFQIGPRSWSSQRTDQVQRSSLSASAAAKHRRWSLVQIGLSMVGELWGS